MLGVAAMLGACCPLSLLCWATRLRWRMGQQIASMLPASREGHGKEAHGLVCKLINQE